MRREYVHSAGARGLEGAVGHLVLLGLGLHRGGADHLGQVLGAHRLQRVGGAAGAADARLEAGVHARDHVELAGGQGGQLGEVDLGLLAVDDHVALGGGHKLKVCALEVGGPCGLALRFGLVGLGGGGSARGPCVWGAVCVWM